MSGVPIAGAASTAGYVATVANAIKACGTVVRVEPNEFLTIVARQENPLVVRAKSKFISTSYRYLTSYKGLAFHCKSSTELLLPSNAEFINAKKISIPDL